MSKDELKVMCFLLISMVDGLLKVCDENEIVIGNMEFQRDGKSESWPFAVVLEMARTKLGADRADISVAQQS
jgi:hypothetical protein